jgi:DNA-binding response OmpR family regulator
MMKRRVIEFTEHSHASYAASGKQALEAIARQRPDIILLDRMLPDMSCLDVVQAVRRNENTKSVLIVGMSAKPPERSECLAAGCDEFILKPFGIRKLLDRLCSVL